MRAHGGGASPLKRVVSVSLGSSKRNHAVHAFIAGQEFKIERIGTDGDLAKAEAMIRELDGKVDVFGLGGIDLYIRAGSRRYLLRDAVRLVRAARVTPIVDGSGLKDTLERRVIDILKRCYGITFTRKKVFLVCALDRFGMAEALLAQGANVTFGDAMFTLGVPIPIRSLRTLDLAARVVAPLACKLPVRYLYPTGKEQERRKPKYSKYFLEADVIAGDFHYIRRYMPDRLPEKTVLTNTVTENDLKFLAGAGVSTLITTTPEMGGRSFGTNMMEAVIVALSGKRPEQLGPSDYDRILTEISFMPRVEYL